MTRDSLKILRLIASYINKGESTGDVINKLLMKEGFSPDEIDKAYSWLKGLTMNGDLRVAIKDDNGDYYTNGGLNANEPLKINEDAYGFLIRLKEMGLVDAQLQEEIIEMAMLAAEDEIGIDDIKGITAMLIFDHSPNRWQSDIIDVLNGRGEKIYH